MSNKKMNDFDKLKSILNDNPFAATKDNNFSPVDPNGSYTGSAKNGEKPVQDVDDL